MGYDAAICRCDDYSSDAVKAALREAIDAVDGFAFVRSGMRVAVKANLMMAKKPEAAATVHPAVAVALCELLFERGVGSVVVGDSPGGPFAAPYLSAVYNASGMRAVETCGATLNDDYSEREVEFSDAVAAKQFSATDYLCKADAIIDLCKIKTHGLMAYTGACKNMFGTIPGMKKCEYHYHYPTHELFADMLVDLYEWHKPALSVADAIVCMEGNGPSAGRPKKVGALLVSKNGHALDMAGAHMIGLRPCDVPTLGAAIKRKLVPPSLDGISVYGDVEKFVCGDFELVEKHDIRLWGRGSGVVVEKLLEGIFASRPLIARDECVGCGECARLCPGKAITVKDKKASIDRKKCISCFCCQEFCPKGAIRVHRPRMAAVLAKLDSVGRRAK